MSSSASFKQKITRRGPQVDLCKDSNGNNTKALIGFMKSINVESENDLTETIDNGKRYVLYNGIKDGDDISDLLGSLVEKSLLDLSTPRMMSWSNNNFRFIRPVTGVLMMHDEKVINGTIMNIPSKDTTKGHQVLANKDIKIKRAIDYEKTMLLEGMVIVDARKRKEEIKKQILDVTEGKGFFVNFSDNKNELESVHNDENSLLDEITGTCEYPVVYEGQIKNAESFPDFALTSCMKKHQKFFPVYNNDGKLNRNRYFFVANNKPNDPTLMIKNYNSVIQARLSDLSFYYNEDKKHSADYYLNKMKDSVNTGDYDSYERFRGIATIIGDIMNLNDSDKNLLQKACYYCKTDLTTLMVSEYPDMAGKVAANYFCTGEVARIVHHHNYLIDESVDISRAYYALVLADKLEKIICLWADGKKPTGSKDMFGLRGYANDVMKILRDRETNLNGFELLKNSTCQFKNLDNIDLVEIWDFIIARMPIYEIKNQTDRQKQISVELQKSASSNKNLLLSDMDKRKAALAQFSCLPEAEIIISASKRINNIFRKSEIDIFSIPCVDTKLFKNEAEVLLNNSIIKLKKDMNNNEKDIDYVKSLKKLSEIAGVVDNFFEKVMINCDDEKTRKNRFSLLLDLSHVLNYVTKFSCNSSKVNGDGSKSKKQKTESFVRDII